MHTASRAVVTTEQRTTGVQTPSDGAVHTTPASVSSSRPRSIGERGPGEAERTQRGRVGKKGRQSGEGQSGEGVGGGGRKWEEVRGRVGGGSTVGRRGVVHTLIIF